MGGQRGSISSLGAFRLWLKTTVTATFSYARPQSGVVVYPCNARNWDPDTEYKISLSYIARPFLKKTI